MKNKDIWFALSLISELRVFITKYENKLNTNKRNGQNSQM
jgi:hypothetical protein